MTRSYRVTWEIIDADSPLEAAQQAWECMRRPDSEANAFSVFDSAGKVHEIDLLDDGAEAWICPNCQRVYGAAEGLPNECECGEKPEGVAP